MEARTASRRLMWSKSVSRKTPAAPLTSAVRIAEPALPGYTTLVSSQAGPSRASTSAGSRSGPPPTSATAPPAASCRAEAREVARSHGLHGNARGAGGREQRTGGLAVGLAVEHDQAQGLAALERRADRRRAGQLPAPSGSGVFRVSGVSGLCTGGRLRRAARGFKSPPAARRSG